MSLLTAAPSGGVVGEVSAGPGVRRASLDYGAALLAVLGLTAAVLLDLPVRTSVHAASDMKTLYASVWCLRHGANAYQTANLQQVFQREGVPVPATWFAHAPVYPLPTLVLLLPLLAVHMTAAVYVVIVGSALLLAWAVGALLRYAEESFGLGIGWRAAMLVACAGCSLVGFGLSMGNLSIAAAALCLVAFTERRRGRGWLPSVALAVAVTLKPHLALWVAVALLLLPDRRARRIAMRTLLFCAGFAAVALAGLALRGDLLPQGHAFATMVRTETGPGGSMSVLSREPLPVMAQITSLRSVLGFWTAADDVLSAAISLLLAGWALLLAVASRRARSEEARLLTTGAWCAFGLLTTYHRAHDATVLLLLLPWVALAVRRAPRWWAVWALGLSCAALCVGAPLDTLKRMALAADQRPWEAFLVMRQAGLAAIGVCLLLTWLAWTSAPGAEARPAPEA